MDISFSGLIPAQLNQVLSILQTKHQTVANNIANTNTPGYVRQEVDFNQALQQVLDATPARETGSRQVEQPGINHLLAQEIEVKQDHATPARTDGNNVNLEQEMVALSQTNQLYKTLTKMASNKLKFYSYIIKGGR